MKDYYCLDIESPNVDHIPSMVSVVLSPRWGFGFFGMALNFTGRCPALIIVGLYPTDKIGTIPNNVWFALFTKWQIFSKQYNAEILIK